MTRIAVAPAPAPTASTAPTNTSLGGGWKQRAAQFFLLLMVFGFPVFSVPCQKGDCFSPLEVVATYGYVKGMFREEWTKGLLYPATLMLNAEVLMGDDPQSFQIPKWDGILSRWNLSADIVEDKPEYGSIKLIPNFLSMFESDNPDSLSWEFVGSCFVCLLGALLSVFGPNKISFWGVLLVLWFIFIEGGKRDDVFVQPMFALAVVCSLGWVNLKDLFQLPREVETPESGAKEKVESKQE